MNTAVFSPCDGKAPLAPRGANGEPSVSTPPPTVPRMDKTTLVAQLSVEIIKQQIASGSKHPSPGLIDEAVTTAHAIVDQLDLDLSKGIEDRLGDELASRTADVQRALSSQAAHISELTSRIQALETKPVAAPAPTPASAPVTPPSAI